MTSGARESSLELRLVIAMEQRVVLELATSLFGPDPDAALVEDTVAELANLTMGGVKASLAEDGVTLTSGLPQPLAFPLAPTAGALSRREHMLTAPDGARLSISVEVTRCPTRRARAFELTEGMILAAPVTNVGGMMLVPGGTRLTSGAIEKIARTLPDQHIEVLVSR